MFRTLAINSVVVCAVLVGHAVYGDVVLLEDDFSGDLSQWACNGQDSYTCEVTGSDGNPPPCVFVDDFLSWGTALISQVAFGYVDREIELTASAKHGNASSADQRYTTVGFSESNATRDRFIYMEIGGSTDPNPDDVNCCLLWDDDGMETWEDSGPLPIHDGDAWNDVRIRIRCDGRVEFFVTGSDTGSDTPIYTSTHAVTPAYDSQAAVAVGNRKSYYDNVRLVELNALEDDFSGDLSQWECNGQDSYTCEITGSDGNPPPCVFVDDFLSWGTALISQDAFSYVGREIELTASAKHGNASSADQRYTTVGFSESNATRDRFIYMEIGGSTDPNPDDVNCCLLWDDDGMETWEDSGPLPIHDGDAWNDVRIRVLCDGRVEFFVTGSDTGSDTPIYRSTHAVTPAYDGQAAVAVGNRKSYYDNVAVTNRCGPYCGISVPTVSEWGMAVMSLLALTAGTLVFMKRKVAMT